MKHQEYIFSLDLARVIAIIGVVAIHVFYPIYSRPDFLGGISWWFAYSINAVSRIAVPFFLMVSGCLLLKRKPGNEIKDTLFRAVFRLGIPLVFWAIVYFWWENKYYGRFTNPGQAIYLFFTGSVFHLYYLVILLGLYLFLPLWRLFINHASEQQKKYSVLMAFILGITIYAMQFFLYKERTILNFFTLWIPYLGYFLVGSYLFDLPKTPRRKMTASIVFFTALIFTIIFGYFNLRFFSQNKLFFWGMGGSEFVTNWLSPNVILMSLAGYFLITKVNNLNRFFEKIIQSIAKASFGIYLIHLIIINVMDKYFGLYLDFQTGKLSFYGLKKMLVVFLISWLATAIIRRISLLRVIIGEKPSGV